MSKCYEHLSDSDSELSSDNFNSVLDESDNLFVSSDSNDDDSIGLSINDLKTDDFVLVKLVYDEKMRKVDKTFVAQILSINDISQELQLKFMQKSTKDNNIFISFLQ